MGLLLGGTGDLLLLLQLLQALLVGSSLLAGVLERGLLLRQTLALVAQRAVGHQALDAGCLVSLVSVVLELAADHELAHVVLLRQTEQLADVARSLGTQAAGLRGRLVRQTGDLLLALLHDHQVQHADVRTHDAATHRLSLALTLHIKWKLKEQQCDELCSKTCRRREEGAHGGCRAHPASWRNPAYRFLQ